MYTAKGLQSNPNEQTEIYAAITDAETIVCVISQRERERRERSCVQQSLQCTCISLFFLVSESSGLLMIYYRSHRYHEEGEKDPRFASFKPGVVR